MVLTLLKGEFLLVIAYIRLDLLNRNPLDQEGKLGIEFIGIGRTTGLVQIGRKGHGEAGIPVSQVVDKGEAERFQLKARLPPQLYVIKPEGVEEILKKIGLRVLVKIPREIAEKRQVGEIPEDLGVLGVGRKGYIHKIRYPSGKTQGKIIPRIGITLEIETKAGVQIQGKSDPVIPDAVLSKGL
jgi:hypothetical protein